MLPLPRPAGVMAAHTLLCGQWDQYFDPVTRTIETFTHAGLPESNARLGAPGSSEEWLT